ncbi:MAG: aminopeptidase C, partial [Lepagella sp.]
MKRILTLALACAALPVLAQAPEAKTDTAKGFRFTDIKTVKTGSVKDQNKSGTCWAFSGTSFVEDEIMRKGGPELDLSEMFTVRHCYDDKADKYMRMDGTINFAQGGGLWDIMYVLDNYGLVPEEAYAGLEYGAKKHEHYELADGLTGYLKGVMRSKKRSTAWKQGFDGILDAYLGKLPESFTYNGRKYTPRTFADQFGIRPEDYICVTSFTHHPFYRSFPLEVADNWLWAPYQNVPMEEMKAIVDNALENGYSVAWAADVSEGGFKWTEGVAVIPEEINPDNLEGTELSKWVTLSDKDRAAKRFKFDGPVKEVVPTQQMRQEGLDSHETTDDHGMTIVGIATDQEGNRYYKVKNSWDTNQKYGGYFYCSEPYFLLKTMGI